MAQLQTFGQVLSPLLSAGTSMANQFGQGIMTLLANNANEARYGQGFNILGSLANRHVGQSQVLADQALRQYQGLLPQYRQMAGNLMRYLDTSGDQEYRDINTQFDNLQSQAAQNLTSRGLSASTVVPSVQGGIGRQRADALGALRERIRAMKFGAEERLGTNLYNLQDQNIGRWLQLQQMPMQTERELTFPIVNWIGNRNDVAPDEGIYAQNQAMLGPGFFGSLVRPPDYPEPDNGFLSGLGGAFGIGAGAGLGAGAGAGLAGLFGGGGGGAALAGSLAAKMMVCIDARCRVHVRRGRSYAMRPLADIRVGDRVATPKGYRKVLFIDIGHTRPPHRGTYKRVTSDRGVITLTLDHIFEAPDTGVISELVPPPPAAADLLVEGSDCYYCEGYLVKSMISHYGLTPQDCEELRGKMEIPA